MAALSDGTVVTYGQKDGVWKLKRFSMKERRAIFSEELSNEPHGLTEIALGCTLAIAISYR